MINATGGVGKVGKNIAYLETRNFSYGLLLRNILDWQHNSISLH